MRRMITFVCASLLIPAVAAAQPKTPDDWYKEGETQYNLGNFGGAVDAFKKGFELEPNESKKSAYLYNVAQAYRQAKDCSNAQFFYKRYLALKENDAKKPLKPEKRQEIEDRIKELDECAKQQEAIRQKPPEQNLRPDEGNGDKDEGDKPAGNKVAPDKRVGDTTEGDGGEGRITRSVPGNAPRLLSVRLEGGGAKLSTGDVQVPIQATVALFGGYPLSLGEQLTLELGAGFTFTPVPYESMGTSKSAAFTTLVADVGATYEVIPKLGVRGDVGIGALLFTGASESPFTANAPTTGALAMLHVRIGVSADYAITPNVIATITPFAFSYSPPKAGLRDDIKSITAIDFMVGLGYRM